jgi:uncharacterized membrane-anchored protein
MRGPGAFIARFVLYAIGIGLATVVARVEWTSLGLDATANGFGPNASSLTALYAGAPVLIALATIVLAALAAVSRLLATLLVWAVISAIVVAPFAIARATGG